MQSTGPSYAAEINTTSVYFDFITLEEDLVEYRFSIETNATWGCEYSFGGDGGGIAAVLIPTCAIDAEPLACARSDPIIIEPPDTDASQPLVDLVIPAGLLEPQTLYRIRLRTVRPNDCGCFSPCVSARVFPSPPVNAQCGEPFLLTRTAHFGNIPDIYGITLYPTRSPTPAPTRTVSPTSSPTLQPTASPIVIVPDCSTHIPDGNGVCQGPATACSGCTCACYDSVTNAYFGACSLSYFNTTGTLCPDPVAFNVTSIDEVCRCLEEGFAVGAYFSIDNPTVLACTNGSLLYNPLLQQLVTLLAQFFQISEADVIISDAECGSYVFRLTIVDPEATLLMSQVISVWTAEVHDEALTPALRDAITLIRNAVSTVTVDPFSTFIPHDTPRCFKFTDSFPSSTLDIDTNGVPDHCDYACEDYLPSFVTAQCFEGDYGAFGSECVALPVPSLCSCQCFTNMSVALNLTCAVYTPLAPILSGQSERLVFVESSMSSFDVHSYPEPVFDAVSYDTEIGEAWEWHNVDISDEEWAELMADAPSVTDDALQEYFNADRKRQTTPGSHCTNAFRMCINPTVTAFSTADQNPEIEETNACVDQMGNTIAVCNVNPPISCPGPQSHYHIDVSTGWAPSVFFSGSASRENVIDVYNFGTNPTAYNTTTCATRVCAGPASARRYSCVTGPGHLDVNYGFTVGYYMIYAIRAYHGSINSTLNSCSFLSDLPYTFYRKNQLSPKPAYTVANGCGSISGLSFCPSTSYIPIVADTSGDFKTLKHYLNSTNMATNQPEFYQTQKALTCGSGKIMSEAWAGATFAVDTRSYFTATITAIDQPAPAQNITIVAQIYLSSTCVSGAPIACTTLNTNSLPASVRYLNTGGLSGFTVRFAYIGPTGLVTDRQVFTSEVRFDAVPVDGCEDAAPASLVETEETRTAFENYLPIASPSFMSGTAQPRIVACSSSVPAFATEHWKIVQCAANSRFSAYYANASSVPAILEVYTVTSTSDTTCMSGATAVGCTTQPYTLVTHSGSSTYYAVRIISSAQNITMVTMCRPLTACASMKTATSGTPVAIYLGDTNANGYFTNGVVDPQPFCLNAPPLNVGTLLYAQEHWAEYTPTCTGSLVIESTIYDDIAQLPSSEEGFADILVRQLLTANASGGATPTQFAGGDQVVIRFGALNLGPDRASNVSFLITVPAGVTPGLTSFSSVGCSFLNTTTILCQKTLSQTQYTMGYQCGVACCGGSCTFTHSVNVFLPYGVLSSWQFRVCVSSEKIDANETNSCGDSPVIPVLSNTAAPTPIPTTSGTTDMATRLLATRNVTGGAVLTQLVGGEAVAIRFGVINLGNERAFEPYYVIHVPLGTAPYNLAVSVGVTCSFTNITTITCIEDSPLGYLCGGSCCSGTCSYNREVQVYIPYTLPTWQYTACAYSEKTDPNATNTCNDSPVVPVTITPTQSPTPMPTFIPTASPTPMPFSQNLHVFEVRSSKCSGSATLMGCADVMQTTQTLTGITNVTYGVPVYIRRIIQAEYYTTFLKTVYSVQCIALTGCLPTLQYTGTGAFPLAGLTSNTNNYFPAGSLYPRCSALPPAGTGELWGFHYATCSGAMRVSVTGSATTVALELHSVCNPTANTTECGAGGVGNVTRSVVFGEEVWIRVVANSSNLAAQTLHIACDWPAPGYELCAQASEIGANPRCTCAPPTPGPVATSLFEEQRGTISPRRPTKAPTRMPTRVPTRHPTQRPTKLPTRQPTRVPTKQPTNPPTRVPTKQPTRPPTKAPTKQPTKLPTKAPTLLPTRNPTAPPTLGPTRNPTAQPTKLPTRNPTQQPSNGPTPPPTFVPTKQPVTSAPTSAPITCPAIGRCTSSSADLYAFCARAGQCPAGSVPDRNLTLGETCLGDGSAESCVCCERSCGSAWLSSACATDTASGDYKTCVAAGTCVSRFRGVRSSLSCGSGSCECCNLLQTPPASAPTPPMQFINQCEDGVSDNDAQGDEACDGTDLRGHSCVSLGYAGGTLRCTPWCDTYDAAACIPYGACCNGTAMSNCAPRTTASACTGSSKRFVANAPVCTPNLCAAAFSSYSAAVPSALQPAGTNIELGSQTIGAGSMLPNTFATIPASSCSGCFLGTVGGMLRAANGSLYVVSNAHVWATPASRSQTDQCARPHPPLRGTLVAQAASCTVSSGRPLGTLTAFSHLTPGGESKYDAALALVTPSATSPWPVVMGLGAQTSGAPATPALGMIIIKASRTTGFRVAQIVGVDVTSYVSGSSDDGSSSNYVQTYVGQFMAYSLADDGVFSSGGDSGSMVFEYSSMKMLGLLFAGSSSGRALISPLGPILTDFFPDGGATVAGLDDLLRKRDVEGRELLERLTEPLPEDGFAPRGGRRLQSITAPSRAAVGRVTVNQLRTLRGHRIIGELAANRTLISHYVGFSPSEPSVPRLYVTVSSAEAAATARRTMPSEIDGVPLSVQHGHPMKFY